MNDLIFIACAGGLRDGLNPCIFMAGAVFISYDLWLEKTQLPRGWLLFVFILIYALGVVVFNFGSAQSLILQKKFIFFATILYFLLGIWAMVSGILFFKEWLFMDRGASMDTPGQKLNVSSWGSIAIGLASIVLAMVLSAMSTLWPVNRYILILGNAAIFKGQGQEVVPILAGYALSSSWALWLIWAILNIKGLRPSLLKIACSAVYLTASSCLIFMFKQGWQ